MCGAGLSFVRDVVQSVTASKRHSRYKCCLAFGCESVYTEHKVSKAEESRERRGSTWLLGYGRRWQVVELGQTLPEEILRRGTIDESQLQIH